MISEAVAAHRASAPVQLGIAVLTVSDTRTEATDTSGALIVEKCAAEGHRILERAITPDEPERMRPLLKQWCDRPEIHAVLITGGTGISPRDQTYETVSALLTKPIPGFGELFRMLSFQEIGPAAALSRAVAGLVHQTAVIVMPGSRAAVELALDRLVLPELRHLVGQARRAH